MPRTVISTTKYENAHGHKPRGYGMWTFVTTFGHEVSGEGIYGECREACQVEARKQHMNLAEVLP